VLAARDLARSYDRALAAAWRGDDDRAVLFAGWLGQYWDEAPPEPAVTPAAVSPLGAAGRGIRWHETPDAILGYVRDWNRPCGYRVPRTARPPF
jgi:hypothetical protein